MIDDRRRLGVDGRGDRLGLIGAGDEDDTEGESSARDNASEEDH